MVLLCGRRSGAISEDEMQSLCSGLRSWPTLPSESVLRLTPERVTVEQHGRDLGPTTGRPNPEGDVRQRLEELRLRLCERFDCLEGLAFCHQQ